MFVQRWSARGLVSTTGLVSTAPVSGRDARGHSDADPPGRIDPTTIKDSAVFAHALPVKRYSWRNAHRIHPNCKTLMLSAVTFLFAAYLCKDWVTSALSRIGLCSVVPVHVMVVPNPTLESCRAQKLRGPVSKKISDLTWSTNRATNIRNFGIDQVYDHLEMNLIKGLRGLTLTSARVLVRAHVDGQSCPPNDAKKKLRRALSPTLAV